MRLYIVPCIFAIISLCQAELRIGMFPELKLNLPNIESLLKGMKEGGSPAFNFGVDIDDVNCNIKVLIPDLNPKEDSLRIFVDPEKDIPNTSGYVTIQFSKVRKSTAEEGRKFLSPQRGQSEPKEESSKPRERDYKEKEESDEKEEEQPKFHFSSVSVSSQTFPLPAYCDATKPQKSNFKPQQDKSLTLRFPVNKKLKLQYEQEAERNAEKESPVKNARSGHLEKPERWEMKKDHEEF